MSLRVWLPLNGDLKNNGLSNVAVTNNGATVDNNGKIGKCYSFDGSNDKISGIYNANLNISFCCWINIITLKNCHILDGRLSDASKGYQPICITNNGTTIQYGSTGSGWRNYNYSFVVNTWYHIAVIHNETIGKLYINGILVDSSTTAKGADLGQCNFTLGCRCNSTNYANVKINDFRIYDHALSVKEVKEISKGLVCHYKLDDRYVSDNLIINGFGELGNENWTSSTNISTTEIPPNHSEIKASFYNGNMTKEYIPINSNHSYTISGYVKTTGATTGTTYPSIYPYDYDKKFIWVYNCSEGFSTQYKTTLAQPLKKGDTVIYATNLSAWTTGNNYYFHVAIFGYKNSSGYTYPDMIYTADSPVFGTKTDKSHIDKINNTITLNAPFTGEDRPAGTTICQSTEGSTYYYPWGGLGLGGLQDWVFKTATFIPKNIGRLKPCKYIRWSTYGSCYIAGNKLVDNNDNNSVIYDSSGYNHHGTRMTDTLSCSTDTARNSLSINFNGTDDGILIENLDLSPIINNSATYSFWIKPNGENGARSIYFGMYSGTSWSIEKGTGNILRSYWAGSPDEYCSGASVADGVWQHICIVKDGTNSIKVYINGVLKWTSTATHSNKTFSTTCRIGRDTRSGDSTPYKGLMSDFRIYATALSEDDILELYQVGASIDKNGNMFAYEFKED